MSEPALYGHPFSSYTWKAQIALDAGAIAHDFRVIDDEHPEHGAFVATQGGPWGLFPVLEHDGRVVFEGTSIIEYADRHLSPMIPLIAPDPDAANGMRMLDRVFDNYVMTPMQMIVGEHLRKGGADAGRCAQARDRLDKSYAWLNAWLARYPHDATGITLIECAAAPSLFYADWVAPIGDDYPRLKNWRAHLLALPPVARCVERARPFRAGFPPGPPDRD